MVFLLLVYIPVTFLVECIQNIEGFTDRDGLFWLEIVRSELILPREIIANTKSCDLIFVSASFIEPFFIWRRKKGDSENRKKPFYVFSSANGCGIADI